MMKVLSRWLMAARIVGVFATLFGALGFGITYAWESALMPEYQSGLFLCGLLVIGGIAMTAASQAVRQGSTASLVNLAACSTMVATLLAATGERVLLRLWLAVVVHFS